MLFFLVLCFAAIFAIRLIPHETSPFLSSPFVGLVVVVVALALPRPHIRQAVTWFHSTQNKTKTKNPIRRTKKKLLLLGVAPFFFPIMRRSLSLSFSFWFAAFFLSGEFSAILRRPEVYFSTCLIRSPLLPSPCVTECKKKCIYIRIYLFVASPLLISVLYVRTRGNNIFFVDAVVGVCRYIDPTTEQQEIEAWKEAEGRGEPFHREPFWGTALWDARRRIQKIKKKKNRNFSPSLFFFVFAATTTFLSPSPLHIQLKRPTIFIPPRRKANGKNT